MAMEKYLSTIPAVLGQWAGPILDKELRVASRRRRYYVLRSVYVGLLCLFVGYTWFFNVQAGSYGSNAFIASRMPEAGKAITATILWFQFIFAQLLACVLLCSAVGDEIRARTLGVLLTTHINSFQIIFGKLASRLIQMMLLLAISLPLLAIVRVFGGVPWSSVWAGIIITAAGMLFIGSLSLLVSCYVPQGYRAILVALILCTGIFLLFPLGLLLLAHLNVLSHNTAESIALLTNPFMGMAQVTENLFIGGTAGLWRVPWYWHCIVMLAGTGLFLGISTLAIRRIALQGGDTVKRKAGRGILGLMDRISGKSGGIRTDTETPILRIKGSPIIWREMWSPFMRRQLGQIITYVILGTILVLFVVFSIWHRELGIGISMGTASVMLFLLMIRLGVQAGSCISREKEGRTWPVLLTTPMDDEQIIRDKALAVVGRNLPVLVFLLCVQVLNVMLLAADDPLTVTMMIGTPFAATASIVFVTGMGLFFSVSMRSSVTSVVVTLAIYFGATYFCCGCAGPLISFAMMGVMVADGGPGTETILGLLMQGIPVVVWTVAGLLFAKLAIDKVRRNVF